MEPIFIEYHELVQITDGFSDMRKIGEGGYGKVYWGVHGNRDEIAVKMLQEKFALDDNQFQNEFGHHFKLKHDNIVRLVGFCHESKGRDVIEYEGKCIVPEKRYRILCFEYMHNGSLQKHLSDESVKLNWHTSYKIIKGTCEGLKYLHDRPKPILHLDLKPDNILLDKNMVAKLADFGLSKIFDDKKTKITRNVKGTPGYMPPEFINENMISVKNDIFSLGVVIMEIMMGPTGYSQFKEMSSNSLETSDKGMSFREDNEKLFIGLVQEKWRCELQGTCCDSLLEEYCRQVKICIEIAIKCVHDDREERPSIVAIIEILNKAEPVIDKENKINVPTYGLTAHKTLDIVRLPVVKLGMWGGNEGSYYDLGVMPRRLLTVTIHCGGAIDSIAFSYIGIDLNEHTVGRWGGPYGENRKIILGPNEIVKKISGTHGSYETERDVIRSLTIVTNVKRYSFGDATGNPFRIRVENNGHIVGFYARSKGWLLNAFGIYVHP